MDSHLIIRSIVSCSPSNPTSFPSELAEMPAAIFFIRPNAREKRCRAMSRRIKCWNANILVFSKKAALSGSSTVLEVKAQSDLEFKPSVIFGRRANSSGSEKIFGVVVAVTRDEKLVEPG